MTQGEIEAAVTDYLGSQVGTLLLPNTAARIEAELEALTGCAVKAAVYLADGSIEVDINAPATPFRATLGSGISVVQ